MLGGARLLSTLRVCGKKNVTVLIFLYIILCGCVIMYGKFLGRKGMCKRLVILLLCFVSMSARADILPLDDALRATYVACVGIDDELADLKKMAGINTAVTAVGTVAGGVALGTGIAKASVDAEAEEIEAELLKEIEKLNKLAAEQTDFDLIPDFDVPEDGSSQVSTATTSTDTPIAAQQSAADEKQAELDKLTKKSKTLGNIRTGTMAGAAVADTVGTVIAANNRVKGDLQSQINECVARHKRTE